MNALTGAGVSVDDALFETLDPTTRRVELDGHEVLLSDTVGFIRHLPHQLVTAFSATLEEAREADLVLHVADASEPEAPRAARADAVDEVLDGDRRRRAAPAPRAEQDRPRRRRRAPGPRQPPPRRASRSRPAPARASTAWASASPTPPATRLTAVDVTIPFALSGLVSTVYAEGSEVRQEPTDEGTRVRALMPPGRRGPDHRRPANGASPA